MFRELIEDVKAFFRKEKRVAPRGVRGRVYARKYGDNTNPGDMRTKSKVVTLTRIRVYRKDTGKWEEIDMGKEGKG